METPEDYSEEKIQELAKKYIEKAKEINATRSENISDQTVIYILSESLANPDRIPGVTLSDSVSPSNNTPSPVFFNKPSGKVKLDSTPSVKPLNITSKLVPTIFILSIVQPLTTISLIDLLTEVVYPLSLTFVKAKLIVA